MAHDLDDKPCIARDWEREGWRGGTQRKRDLLTVAEYDRAVTMGVLWTRPSALGLPSPPPVESLTREGIDVRHGRLYICDYEAYVRQMRRLLGLV